MPRSPLPAPRRFVKPETGAWIWGSTPYDNLTREEMLTMLKAYHIALTHTESVCKMMQLNNPTYEYWKPHGSGGRALCMVDEIMTRIGMRRDNTREAFYYSFFRYAENIMFTKLDRREKFDNWGLHPSGEMRAPCPQEKPWRPLRWSDMKRKPTDEPQG